MDEKWVKGIGLLISAIYIVMLSIGVMEGELKTFFIATTIGIIFIGMVAYGTKLLYDAY